MACSYLYASRNRTYRYLDYYDLVSWNRLCLYHHYCSLDKPVNLLTVIWTCGKPKSLWQKYTIPIISTAPNTSVIFKQAVTPLDPFQHRRIHYLPSHFQHLSLAYDLPVLPFINHKELSRPYPSVIIMALTTRDLEVLSAAFQCLKDPDAFKVSHLIPITGASCNSVSLTINFHRKFCLLF